MPLISEPIDLMLDDNGDVFIDTDAYLCAGLDAVTQGCRVACRFIRGEWFMDLDQGVPLMESAAGRVAEDRALLGGKFNKARAESDYRQALQKVIGVGQIHYVTASFDSKTRTLSIAWEVVAVFGDVVTDSMSLTV